MRVFRHFGAPGLFLLAILDSTPIPTLGGPDILNMILAARHGDPWYYYATAATLGSVLGAYVAFSMARRAGSAYLEKTFGERRVGIVLKYFEKWGTGTLALSAFFPFPFPTSAFFAAAGILNYPLRTFIAVVAAARAGRYFILAALASHYGRSFIHLIRHPGEHTTWFVLIICGVSIVAAAAILVMQRTGRRQSA